MCTLVIERDEENSAFPLSIYANRDEFMDRDSRSPAPLRGPDGGGWIVAGSDAVAGGTWVGLSGAGFVTAILNRRSEAPPDPSRRSRGLLCLDLLSAKTFVEAVADLRMLVPEDYNPFTVLVASRDAAVAATNHGGRLRTVSLPLGVSVLTNLEIDDLECPRGLAARRLFESSDAVGTESEILARARRILADHGTAERPEDAICLHMGAYGTRSSTVLSLSGSGDWTYWYASGAPCRAEFQQVPLPFGGGR